MKLVADNMEELKSKEEDLIEDFKAEDRYFGTDENEELIEALESREFDSSEDHGEMIIDAGVDKRTHELYETFDDGIMKTGIKASNLEDLEEKEMEMVKTLKDADMIFGDDHNEQKIELLEELYKLQKAQ